jgi:CheY-like chemotaxis protein
MDGYQAAEQIRKSGHSIPIIAMSADEDDETRAAAFRSGMNEYVMKPARVESIKQLLIKLFSTSI